MIGQWGYLKRKYPNVTRVTMGPLALCRRTLGGDAIGAQFSAWARRMSGLTRDGTAEPVSRDQIPRCDRGQRKIVFSLFS